MIPVQRHERLLQLLRQDGVRSTRSLTDALGVSHMTVRRDIARLEADGLVESVAGGVRLATDAGQQPPSPRRQRSGLELGRKHAIAERAVELVEDGMAVYLDAGTTCEATVPLLARRRGLTVVTNDFWSVIALLDHPEIETIHIGGRVDAESASSCGALSTRILDAIRIDVFFLSAGAWSVSAGVTAPSEDKLELKRRVRDVSRRTALLADSTKFGASAHYRVFDLGELDVLITDDGLAAEARTQVEETGTDLWLARVTEDEARI